MVIVYVVYYQLQALQYGMQQNDFLFTLLLALTITDVHLPQQKLSHPGQLLIPYKNKINSFFFSDSFGKRSL